MAALTVQNLTDLGTAPTPVAASVSDTASIGTGSNTWLEYANTDANVKTLTVVSHFTLDNGDTAGNHVVSLPATTGKVRIPLRKSYDDNTGSATVNLTGTGGVTGVTVALVRLP